MNRITGIMRMHSKNPLNWIYMPWIILLGNFLINLIVATSVNSEESYVGGGISSIFIYFMIMGMITIHMTFPFALGLSIRRKDYFTGTVLYAGAIALSNSVVMVILSEIERMTDGWGSRIHFFEIPYVSDDGILGQLWFFLALFLHLFFISFLGAAFQRRLGTVQLMIALGVIFIAGTALSLLATYYGWWGDLFDLLSGRSAVEIISWCSLLTIVYILGSFGFLRKATV